MEIKNELHNTNECSKKGIITPEMKIVAAKEKMNIEELKTLIAQGKVVIPANKYHTCINVNGIGSMLKTKINVKSWNF